MEKTLYLNGYIWLDFSAPDTPKFAILLLLSTSGLKNNNNYWFACTSYLGAQYTYWVFLIDARKFIP